MAQSYLIEVAHKPGVTDPVGKGLTHDIMELGLGRVKNVASAQLYRLDGQLSESDRKRIAEDLLCDPILQEYREDTPVKSEGKSGSLVIDIWYKTGVTDVVGDSVLKGIEDLNIHGVKAVRTGMRYHLAGVTRKEEAEKISLALLANPLVHESVVHVD
jgi:phosphoribosylformylglycinamidine (FGAM) synthase PurS component